MGRGRQRKEVEAEGSRRRRELRRGRTLVVTGDHYSRRLRLREKVEGNEPRVGGEAAGREILFSRNAWSAVGSTKMKIERVAARGLKSAQEGM
jgi:hypothetical protein